MNSPSIDKIINLLKPDKDKFKNLTNPKKDWKIILIIFTGSLFLIIFIHLSFFIKISNNDFFFTPTSETTNSIVEINQGKLDEAVNYLKDKEKKFKKLIDEKPYLADPSL